MFYSWLLEYFPVGVVLEGLSLLCNQLFGIQLSVDTPGPNEVCPPPLPLLIYLFCLGLGLQCS